jgi:hypothetical protein
LYLQTLTKQVAWCARVYRKLAPHPAGFFDANDSNPFGHKNRSHDMAFERTWVPSTVRAKSLLGVRRLAAAFFHAEAFAPACMFGGLLRRQCRQRLLRISNRYKKY